MPRKMISTSCYLTPEQDERLRKLHAATRVPVSVYIREGIDMVLDLYEAHAEASAPSDEPVSTRLLSSHDDGDPDPDPPVEKTSRSPWRKNLMLRRRK